MDLAKQALIIDTIRETLNEYVGQKLHVRANMGRSKIVQNEGLLLQVHPQLFIMEIKRKRGVAARQSYQYVDILTGMVELSINGEKIFGTFIEDESKDDEVPNQDDALNEDQNEMEDDLI